MQLIDTVIAIHGRDSSADKSKTVGALKNYFGTRGYNVVTPSYDSTADYEVIKAGFDHFIDGLSKKSCYAVFGISLGGFWARYVANRLISDGRLMVNLVMINPSLTFYSANLLVDHPDLPITLYIALDDDVVPPETALRLYQNRARVHVYPDGGHRFHHLAAVLPVMEEEINAVP